VAVATAAADLVAVAAAVVTRSNAKVSY
jgi:hypothetical protein